MNATEFDADVIAARMRDYEAQVADLRQRFKDFETFAFDLEARVCALEVKTTSGAPVAAPSEGAANTDHAGRPDTSTPVKEVLGSPSASTATAGEGSCNPLVQTASPAGDPSSRPTLDEAYSEAEKLVESPVVVSKKRGRPKGSKNKKSAPGASEAAGSGGVAGAGTTAEVSAARSAAPAAFSTPAASPSLVSLVDPSSLVEPGKGLPW